MKPLLYTALVLGGFFFNSKKKKKKIKENSGFSVAAALEAYTHLISSPRALWAPSLVRCEKENLRLKVSNPTVVKSSAFWCSYPAEIILFFYSNATRRWPSKTWKVIFYYTPKNRWAPLPTKTITRFGCMFNLPTLFSRNGSGGKSHLKKKTQNKMFKSKGGIEK